MLKLANTILYRIIKVRFVVGRIVGRASAAFVISRDENKL